MKRIALIALVVAGSAAAQDAPFPIAAWSRTKAAVETEGSPAERGAAVFNNWCSACHSRGPQNAPGTTSLQAKYQGSVPAALQDRVLGGGSSVKHALRGVPKGSWYGPIQPS